MKVHKTKQEGKGEDNDVELLLDQVEVLYCPV